MKLDELKYAFQNLMHRRLRSFLSALSILIGITAIFALVSFGLGLQNYMDVIGQEMGADKLFVMAKGIGAPGTDNNFYITKDDIEFLTKNKDVKEGTGLYMKAVQVEEEKEKSYAFIMGYDPKKQKFVNEAMTVGVLKGRDLKEGDTNKVVLGYSYQKDKKIFKKALKVGDKIKVDGNDVEVLGFYEEIGGPDDTNIYVTSEAFENFYPEKKDKFGYAMLRAQKGIDASELAERLKEKFRKHKGLDEGKEDFYIQSFEDMLAIYGNIILIINGIIFGIAFISVIVAVINIMNTMYTAVTERTREIGIMKSVGAKNSDIFIIFMVESGLLGTVGGGIGIICGFVIATVGGIIAASSGYPMLTPSFPWYLTFACLVGSFLVGTVAGLLPAYQASKQKPVDALRYE